MKARFYISLFTATALVIPVTAQTGPRPASQALRSLNAGSPRGTNASSYATDIAVVSDAQAQALEQAREMLRETENAEQHTALESAIAEMTRAQSALETAKNSPDKLPAAVAAQQAAYQALLKASPREYRMTRNRNGGQGETDQQNRRELDQIEMSREENRYETERQAASQSPQQSEQAQTAARLKELAQRQQDLNDQLRELQTALQAARTEQERTDIERQLKRLRDEQREMLANVDEMRQQSAQSPNASSQADTQKKLDQVRSDMERAAREMEQDSASQALAAGTRAQQAMQNLRNDLRRQGASQFSEQMRELRNKARELAHNQEQIAKDLDSSSNGAKQSLDNSAEREQLVRQMTKQQSALTNLLAGMRTVTEQAEATEPLLSKQLYDTLRRASQTRTEDLLDMGKQLTDRGFLPQASQAERVAHTNITELAQSIERAAESVLGSETEALRYAQTEIDELSRQMEREIGGGMSVTNATSGQPGAGLNQTNFLADARERAAGSGGTNSIGRETGSSREGEARPERGNAQNQSPGNPTENTQAESGSESAEGGSEPGGRNASTAQATQPGREGQNGANNPGGEPAGGTEAGGGGGDGLRQFVQRLSRTDRNRDTGPISGSGYSIWNERLRDVEQILDSQDLRNQLAEVRERTAVFRAEFRERGRTPDGEVVRKQILAPLSQVRVWLQQELARKENSRDLVPLDRDPVPEKYSELVRQYYEKLGGSQ